jgi:hypothetical protein
VAEASEILGITAEAVRTRIKRGKLDSVKEPPDRTGTVYILLEVDQTSTLHYRVKTKPLTKRARTRGWLKCSGSRWRTSKAS